MKMILFSEELRKCLNAAGLSDCGENDAWNYWYQRLMNAYNESVERQIITEQSENAKLRELVRDVVLLAGLNGCDVTNMQMHAHGGDWRAIWERMSELGVPGTEVDA